MVNDLLIITKEVDFVNKFDFFYKRLFVCINKGMVFQPGRH